VTPDHPGTTRQRSKITSVDHLAEIAASFRAAGKTVVQAHGTFDLLHIGHVRHLEQARQEGDVLLVTITADRFVNKGPGRPVFTDILRAEMLASLVIVDWVAINEAPSAEDLLRKVAPDVYVKGSDYTIAADDVTGKIVAERQAVEEGGGRIVFTEDITYSSSSLINRYLSVHDQALSEYLVTLREKSALADLLAAIEGIRDMKVLFVGDAIIDEYVYVLPMGKAPKDNIIATLHQGSERFAGGVFAAANHTASLCAQVDIITCLGSADSDEAFIRSQLKPNVSLKVLHRPNAPTTRKTRYIDQYSMRKLFEVYSMEDSPYPRPLAEERNRILSSDLSGYDIVIVTDFGHGLLDARAVEYLAVNAKFLAVNAQTNSSNIGFNLITKYPRADYICVDTNEARLATHDKFSELEDLVAKELAPRLNCSRLIVTQGKHGCVVKEGVAHVRRVPALTDKVVDNVGAGDAFFSITAPMVARGLPLENAGFLGNAAGALKVGIVGHRSAVEKASLVKFITSLLK
jgi:rfaE bifunctional protein nucleotidyltransferase chain/domain